MPVVVASLLADTSHMSLEEKGAYFTILFTMWLHNGRIADDEKQIARILGLSPRRWRAIADVVRKPLTSAGGELSQKRLTATWLEVQELRRKRAASANTRWHGAAWRSHMQAQHGDRNANKRSKIDSSNSEYDAARETPARPQGPPRKGGWDK
jgi:uncharacterized protein YdaU (DUF1376 family)